METNGYYSWKPSGDKKMDFDFKKIGKIAVIAVVALVVLVAGITCFYTVDDKQQAVVTTFGQVTDVTDAGVHFMLPFGIQKAHKVDVNVYQKIELGYSTDKNGDYVVKTDESSMITGDYNIVNVDSVLTDGKENIQRQVKELVTEILTDYNIGLTLVDVKIQDAEPPTTAVIEAFKAVETAKQQAETVVNDAKAYQNAEIPKAQSEADKLLQNAEYLKQKRINEAIQQVAMFEAMYQEYSRNPEITKSRMYYEALSQILPGVKLYINTGSSSDVQMLLPLESLIGGNNG